MEKDFLQLQCCFSGKKIASLKGLIIKGHWDALDLKMHFAVIVAFICCSSTSVFILQINLRMSLKRFDLALMNYDFLLLRN